MKLKALLTGVALAGGLAMAGTAANASTYLFTAAGTDYDGSFELSSPYLVISTPPLIGSYYFITDTSGAYASDVIVNLQPTDIYTSTSQVLKVSFALDSSGQVALTPGVYAAGDSGTLTISAVPEPATWAMMIMGAGLAGAGLRASRKRQSMVAA